LIINIKRKPLVGLSEYFYG